jgi:5-methylcytosine-specific restriction endonuclease McrA
MARPSGEKNRCGGRWTQARFNSFIKSLLRSGTRRWAPISDVKKRARVRRGVYKCECCGTEGPATIRVDGKKMNNAVVDHIHPIIDPSTGFTTWDDCIERMFCEEDNLQLLCHVCHTEKSNEERALAKERRAKQKEEKSND